MGRRNKKKQQQQQHVKVGNNNNRADDVDEEKLMDLLCDILECSGIWHDDADDDLKESNNNGVVWNKLSSSLVLLVEKLEKVSTTEWGDDDDSSNHYYNYNSNIYDDINNIMEEEETNNTLNGDGNPLDVFLEMEQAVQEVQIQAGLFLSTNQDLSYELDLCQELHNKSNSRHYAVAARSFKTGKNSTSTTNIITNNNTTRLLHLRPLSGSLITFFKHRRYLIRQAVQTINDCIYKIYSSSSSSSDDYCNNNTYYGEIITQLKQISIQIKNRFGIINSKEHPFHEIIQIINNLHQKNQDDNNKSNIDDDNQQQQQQHPIDVCTTTTTPTHHALSSSEKITLVDKKKASTSSTSFIDDPKNKEEFTMLDGNDSSLLPPTIRDAINAFLSAGNNKNNKQSFSSPPPSTILLYGPEGSGKTYICNKICQILKDKTHNRHHHVKVIRPSLPFDVLGLTVGAAENQLFSMINYSKSITTTTTTTSNSRTNKSILILDDIENLIGIDYEGPSKNLITTMMSTNNNNGKTTTNNGNNTNGESHLICRLRCMLFSLFDILHQTNNYDEDVKFNNNLLVLCTSKTNIGKFTDRFDVTCCLGMPTTQQRKQVILDHAISLASSCVHDNNNDDSADHLMNEVMLSNLVECTSGCSFAELAQYCRQAIFSLRRSSNTHHSSFREDNDGDTGTGISRTDANHEADRDGESAPLPTPPPLPLSPQDFFEALKQQLQSSMPESLRTGMNADFVDMTVLTARDLKQRYLSNQGRVGEDISAVLSKGAISNLPLFGNSAMRAWEDLRRSIVVPVCHAKELNNLLFGGGSKSSPSSSGKTLAGGVLLTGPPGVGKSALAYHCATVASSMNPSVKLIDVSCTSLIHKEVGSSERSIHRLFKIARAAAPCIVLMDGIENVATVRGNDNTTEGTMDRVLSTLLTSLDGIDSAQISSSSSEEEPANTLAIIGITHNVNWIDPALRRPGRLDRILELGLPEKDAREQIILRHLERTDFVSEDLKFPTLQAVAEDVAEQTAGLTGAEIIALCDGAKMLASKQWFEGTQATSPSLQPHHILDALKLRK